ncbi:hypothetical protein Tco_0291252, partial [Tanacetum coccineum]
MRFSTRNGARGNIGRVAGGQYEVQTLVSEMSQSLV